MPMSSVRSSAMRRIPRWARIPSGRLSTAALIPLVAFSAPGQPRSAGQPGSAGKPRELPPLVRYEVRFFLDPVDDRPTKRAVAAAIAALPGVRDLRLPSPDFAVGVGVATFALPGRMERVQDRRVQALVAAESSRFFFVRRTDRRLLQSLKQKVRRQRRVPMGRRPRRHAAVRPALQVLELLLRFRTIARSDSSSYAATPAFAALQLELDAHAALLRTRGVRMPAARVADVFAGLDQVLRKLRGVHEDIDTSWVGDPGEAAAAARRIEVPAFEHHARALRFVAKDAAARGQRIAGNKPVHAAARVRYQRLATHARALADLVERAMGSLCTPRSAVEIFCR